jgi:hypothetical protein
MLAALIRPIVDADSSEQARELFGIALERLARPLPRVAAMRERAEDDLLASTPSRATTGAGCAAPARTPEPNRRRRRPVIRLA